MADLQANPRSSILATYSKDAAALRSRYPAQPNSPHLRRRIRFEPRWKPIGQFNSTALPPDCRVWLDDDGSLTNRLVESGRGEYRVQRLYQGWQVPLASECNLLALPPRQIALVREVTLLLADQPVVFARSVFPVLSLTGSLAHLRRLQNKSLGAILFKHPGMHRCPFELARMPGNSDYLPADLRQTEPAWGRRSRFDIEGKGLMVSEVFLQSFKPWAATLSVHRTQRGKVCAAIVSPKQ
jgi:chorismate--pyruvate lyase